MTTSPVNLNSLPIPPGNFGLPWLGETLNFLNDGDFSKKRQQQFGPIFKTRLFGKNVIFVSGALANRFLFTKEQETFQATWPLSTRILLGPNALATQMGEIHRSRRKILYQAFLPRALDGYLPRMDGIIQGYLEQWGKADEVIWYPQLRRMTFDVAATLFMGEGASKNPHLFPWFETYIQGLFSLPIPLPNTLFGKSQRARTLLLAELEQVIRTRQQHPPSKEDALGILLAARDDNNQPLSLSELKDQILLLLFAGHETLTSALSSFCLLLGQHSDIRERVRHEQNKLQLGQELTAETLKKMPYLDQVLQEVLRLIPPVGGGFRELIQDCQFQGFHFPKGWLVSYQISQTHADPDLYPDPEKFDPERFTSDGSATQNPPFAHVPFGGGLRECLGKEFARLEMKLFATRLIQQFDWTLLPGQNLELVVTPSPRPKDNLRVNLHFLK
jgi:cytochrome P450